jgi:phosphatidylethanolamine/phosphatidyl-N-methylethanolamine N-methyltransferase
MPTTQVSEYSLMTMSHARPSAHPEESSPHARPRGHRGAAGHARPKGAGKLEFFKEFFRSPVELGTFLPTAPAVGRLMCDDMHLDSATAVCECGPGTGPITLAVLERINPAARFFAIEYNARMVAAFRQRFPHLTVYEADATRIRAIARDDEGLEQLDAVLSAVPWMVLPPAVQSAMLRETYESLRPGGRFTMVTYRPEGAPGVKPFRRMMESMFRHVRLKGKVWSNFPPAYVYHAEK